MSQKQKPNLAAALAEIGGSTRRQAAAPLRQAAPAVRHRNEEASDAKASRRAGEGKRPQQPSRIATAPITAHFPKEVRDQLKILAVERNTTIQKLSAEAYNDLFAKYGKPEIAPHHAMTVEK